MFTWYLPPNLTILRISITRTSSRSIVRTSRAISLATSSARTEGRRGLDTKDGAGKGWGGWGGADSAQHSTARWEARIRDCEGDGFLGGGGGWGYRVGGKVSKSGRRLYVCLYVCTYINR